MVQSIQSEAEGTVPQGERGCPKSSWAFQPLPTTTTICESLMMKPYIEREPTSLRYSSHHVLALIACQCIAKSFNSQRGSTANAREAFWESLNRRSRDHRSFIGRLCAPALIRRDVRFSHVEQESPSEHS